MLAKILNMSTGRCWSSDTYNPHPGVFEGVPSSNDYQGGFGTQLMAKVRAIVHVRPFRCLLAPGLPFDLFGGQI